MEASEVVICRARTEHVDRINEIAQSWRPDGRTDPELSQNGFLVSDFHVEQYKRLVAETDYSFVALHEDQVVGFMVGYSSTDAELVSDFVSQYLLAKLDDFVVIKQVAVDREYVQMGVATRLYAHLIKHAHGARLVAAIVDSPPNIRSRRFHRKLGFIEAFKLAHPDGRTRTVWRYSAERASDESLSAQYEAAIAIYMHEDNLNWNKLQNYLYITVAIAAAVGFLLVQSGVNSIVATTSLVIILCAMGAFTSVAFGVALWSGTIYLLARKKAVCELEDIYINQNGIRIVSAFTQQRILRRSLTMWTLRLTPLVGLSGWLLGGLYLLIKL